jgi:hypothetical protein
MANPTFGGAFNNWASKVPDLEVSDNLLNGDRTDIQRLVSRIHAGKVKQSDFLKVMDVSHLDLSGLGIATDCFRHSSE